MIQSLTDYQCYLLLVRASLRYFIDKKNIDKDIAVLIVEETLKLKRAKQ